jgi:hypothetical protein
VHSKQCNINGLKKKSVEDRGEVPRRMQNAKHFYTLAKRIIKEEIVLKPADGKYAHTLQPFVYEIPDSIGFSGKTTSC